MLEQEGFPFTFYEDLNFFTLVFLTCTPLGNGHGKV